MAVESHCQIRTKCHELRGQMDSFKSEYEKRLMECEENLLQEQIKCREVIKARVDPLETELKTLKLGDASRNMQLREKNERIVGLEREI